jgi:subtilisin family serine protease
MTHRAFKLSVLALSVSALTACGGGGGGGGGGSENPSNPNVPPVTEDTPETNPALALINHDADSEFDGSLVNVAIYDSGIRATHEQFADLAISQYSGSIYSYSIVANANVISVLGETPNDDEDADFTDSNDGRAFHGNAVASTIAGNTFGVSPDSELFVYDVNNNAETDGNDNVTSVDPVFALPDVSSALLHTAENAGWPLGLNFANYSITDVATVLIDDGISEEYIWDDIVANTDVGMIAAAGNDGYSFSDIYVNTATVPECTDEEFDNATGYERERCRALAFERGSNYPTTLFPEYKEHIVIVGAVSASLELERYSNYPGDSCELQERWMVAPGTVRAADAFSDTDLQTISGTSFATPLVTGAAAAVAEKFNSISNHAVLRLLLSTADRSFAGYNAEEHGQGLLDLEAALAANPADYLVGVPNNLRAICP